jgi:hypothetical protein
MSSTTEDCDNKLIVWIDLLLHGKGKPSRVLLTEYPTVLFVSFEYIL